VRLRHDEEANRAGVIARLMHLFATMKREALLEGGKKTYFETQAKPAAAVSAATH
jgi:hypothetical protein